MKIGVRLVLGFAVLIIAMIAIILFGLKGLSDINNKVDELVNNRIPKVKWANNIIDGVNLQARELRNILITNDMDVIANATEHISEASGKIQENVDELTATIKSDEGKKLLAELDKNRKVFVDIRNKALDLAKENTELSKQLAAKVLFDELRPAQLTHIKDINNLISFQEEIQQKSALDAAEQYATARNLMFIIGAIAIVLGIIIALWIIKSITAPINRAVNAANSIANGDMSVDLNTDAKDETGVLLGAMKIMAQNIGNLVSELNKVADTAVQGKLDNRGDENSFKGVYQLIVRGFNNTLDAVIAPLNMTAEYVDRISKGDMPPRIVDEYKGDFNEIKNNLNQCIDSINSLITDANNLTDYAMHAKLRERVDESKHNGDFRRIIKGVHNTLDVMVTLLDSIDVPIMGIDNDYKIVFMNELGAKLDSKSGKELEGGKCYNHFKTSDCNTENCACRRAMTDIKKSSSETDAHPGGLDLEIKYSGFPIKDENGKVLGAFEVIIDQTEIKNAMKLTDKIADFQNHESSKVTEALNKVSLGNVNVEYKCINTDPNLENASKSFIAISDALTLTIDSIKNLTKDADKLANEAAEGNLLFRADETHHKGEYQSIIRGVNQTLDYLITPLNETAEILQIMSTGNLTARIENHYKGDFNKLKNSVNALGDSLSTLITQVNDTVQTTASSAIEISSTAESLAAASQEQSAQADEVASAVEDMSRTVTENAMGANRTSEMAQANSNVATEGGRVVQQTVQKMRDIAVVVENSASNIGKLGESSKQIGEIISVIDDIADQTNLLALNAAIEAARAGEQGRGFAVVADEVRKLAERTTDATKQIAGMIKGIQAETDQAVIAMNKGNEEVQSGIELADKAGQSLESILGSTHELLDMINQIAAASEEQSATSEQISKNVVSISKVTADSTRRIEDVAHTSEDLARLTEHLSELMGQFQVDGSSELSSGKMQKLSKGGNKHLHA